MLRPYSDKGPVNLVGPWVVFAKESRIVTIFTPIISSQDIMVVEGTATPSIAEEIYGSLIQLGIEGPEPVKVAINSPGGGVSAGFTIIQGMEHLKAKGITVITLNMCSAISMAGIILMMGTKGHRYALQDTLILTHFGERNSGGKTARDVEEANKHIERINQRIYELMADNSDIPEFHVQRSELDLVRPEDIKSNRQLRIKLIKQFLDTNVFMSPEEALQAGIIDKVLAPGDPIIDEIYRKVNRGDK